MSRPSPSAPIPYDPAYEIPEDDEIGTTRDITETMHRIQRTTLADGGRPLRAVHAKSHGLLRGELEVLPGLPPELAQGLYARPGRYPLVMRLSTNPGDILDDSVSVPRGMAIKLVGVPGERLPGSEGDHTQDYVLVDGPAFLKPGARQFASSLKLLAATTDRAAGGKKALSAVLRGVERALEAVGAESPQVVSLGGHPNTHPLGETYYSQAPLLHGRYMAKVAVRPVSPELTALEDRPIDVKNRPNALREEVIDVFRRNGGQWYLCVQLCTDLEAMPIEDAKVAWPEELSPYRPVARITVPSQEAWSEARSAAIDDGMAFSPWHGLAAHRPIGSVMRVRRHAYESARQFRAEHNGRPVAEPESLDALP